MDSRTSRAKKNIVVSALTQILTIICGFITPQLLIKAFGSEAYGATSSITQFLAYITLLEGGVAGVAKAALYKPLANNSSDEIGSIVAELKRFFFTIGCIFLVYVIILACSFKSISGVECFDWFSTFLLVIVISISTFAQYFIGITYSVVLQAGQRQYITNAINIITMVINTIMIVLLVNVGANLICVKFLSSLIFVSRPMLMRIYIERNFVITKKKYQKTDVLNQKWTGLGQHIAYFLHTNADIAILTIFSNLKQVAVYSVYNMVISAIQSLTVSFTAGMEAVFGDMIARKEVKLLNKTFGYYETMVSIISVVFYSTMIVLIVPFICVYTQNLTDANYYAPLFAFLLSISSFIFCLRFPYHAVVIAAGKFKETRLASYGEAFINIILSIALVKKFGLAGVAIATVIAISFRFAFYVYFLAKDTLKRSIGLFFKRQTVNIVNFILIYYIGSATALKKPITGYFLWLICGIIVGVEAVIITMVINFIFYKNDFNEVIRKFFKW